MDEKQWEKSWKNPQKKHRSSIGFKRKRVACCYECKNIRRVREGFHFCFLMYEHANKNNIDNLQLWARTLPLMVCDSFKKRGGKTNKGENYA